VDNNSTDETIDLLKDYKNSGFINFYSAPDTGKYDAINKGLLRAKGKYVAFLSCDDFYHDIMAIEDLVNAMEEENADYCIFPSYCSNPDGSAFLYNPSILNVFQVMPCPHQAMFFKREALEKIGYFDAKFKIFADYDLILRLVLGRFNGIMFDRPLVTYRMGEQAVKHSVQVEAECKHIYHKNLKPLYPLNDTQIDRMVNISEIPKDLLDRLADYFPDSKDMFYERYEQMYNMRYQAAEAQREQQRQNRQ
jgi:glycosyltransferase involved in cell wall biosynthesis